MTRGLMDAPEPEQPDNSNEELDNIINELIKGQNKLHDRIIDLERKSDHATAGCKDCKCKQITQEEATAEVEAADRKFWKRGL